MATSPAQRPRERGRPRTAPRAHRATPRVALLMGAGACVLMLVLGLALLGGGRSLFGEAAPAATPTVDPRLIIRARTVPIASILSRGVRLSGTFYPAYPGRNTLRLSVLGGAAPPQGARLTLSATMPGMAMRPIRATLAARGHGYAGAMMLPMFGTYRAGVVVQTARGRATGVITLTLTLPGL